MTNSKRYFDILVKDTTVVIASGVIDETGTLRIKRRVEKVEAGVPSVAASLIFAADVIGNLFKQNISDRITIVMSEQASIRAFEAQKAKKNGVADIGSVLLKSWMTDLTKVSELEANSWETAMTIFGSAVQKYQGQIVWTSARKLYRWEVKGSDPKGADLAKLNGKEVTFTNGANVDLGIVVIDNNRYNETVKLTVTAVRDRQGGVSYKAYVPRYFSVRNDDGTFRLLDAFTVSNPDLEVEAARDTQNAVINVLRLHVRAAEKLPKVRVAKKIVVEDC